MVLLRGRVSLLITFNKIIIIFTKFANLQTSKPTRLFTYILLSYVSTYMRTFMRTYIHAYIHVNIHTYLKHAIMDIY